MLEKRSTKQILADSAMELLSKKPLQKISVQEISANCNVSSRSFYNHFKDKQDLINWMYLQKEKELFENLEKGDSLYDSLLALFRYAEKNQRFFANAGDTGQNNLNDSVFMQAKNTLILAIQKNEELKALDKQTLFMIEFWIHGVCDMSRKMLVGKSTESPEEFMELVIASTPDRLLPYIKSNECRGK